MQSETCINLRNPSAPLSCFENAAKQKTIFGSDAGTSMFQKMSIFAKVPQTHFTYIIASRYALDWCLHWPYLIIRTLLSGLPWDVLYCHSRQQAHLVLPPCYFTKERNWITLSLVLCHIPIGCFVDVGLSRCHIKNLVPNFAPCQTLDKDSLWSPML